MRAAERRETGHFFVFRVESVLAVKGSLRRFAPWTAPGRSERRAAYEGKGGDRAVGREGDLAHDKGYYHSYCGANAPKGTFRPYQPSEPQPPAIGA